MNGGSKFYVPPLGAFRPMGQFPSGHVVDTAKIGVSLAALTHKRKALDAGCLVLLPRNSSSECRSVRPSHQSPRDSVGSVPRVGNWPTHLDEGRNVETESADYPRGEESILPGRFQTFVETSLRVSAWAIFCSGNHQPLHTLRRT